MTQNEFDSQFDAGYLDDLYAEFVMNNAIGSGRIICNGDTLLVAMEDHFLLDAFADTMVD
jgi:hypothetical protein